MTVHYMRNRCYLLPALWVSLDEAGDYRKVRAVPTFILVHIAIWLILIELRNQLLLHAINSFLFL